MELQDPIFQELNEQYEIQTTAEKIWKRGFSQVALQFPDNLLNVSSPIAQAFRTCFVKLHQQDLERTNEELPRVYILGDTSYGSCCVDEVAAQHMQTDCIVHYGPACLSPTTRLPVFYVFGESQKEMDVEACVNSLTAECKDLEDVNAQEATVILLAEPGYHHSLTDVQASIQALGWFKNVIASRLPSEGIPDSLREKHAANTENAGAAAFCQTAYSASMVVAGQIVDELRGESSNLEQDSHLIFFYIGKETSDLMQILLRFQRHTFLRYEPTSQRVIPMTAQSSRLLKRRFFLMQKAKDAQVVGIVVGTLGVQHYLDMIETLRKIIDANGKKAYVFVVGKINVPKLANYAEIDVFVLVSCPSNALIDSKEFYKPIVTPYEMALALNGDDEMWSQTYLVAFDQVLPLLEVDREEEEDHPEFSLVSGSYQQSQVRDEDTCEATELVNKQEQQLSQYYSPAAAFLATRSYQGLAARIGETEAHAAVPGSVGIARGYTQLTEADLETTNLSSL